MKKYTLTQAIETMTEIASNPSPMAASLFTPADVLRILESIELPAPSTGVDIPDEWRDMFIDVLCDDLDDDELIDYDSAKFEIHYNNELRLSQVSIDTYNLKRQLMRRLTAACKDVSDEISYAEQRQEPSGDESTEEANSNNESESNC